MGYDSLYDEINGKNEYKPPFNKKLYTLDDVIIIDVPKEIVEKAKIAALSMDVENEGVKTQDGGAWKNVKGYVGHWAAHIALSEMGMLHDYSEPYVERQYGDKFDIEIAGENYNVKTRGNIRYIESLDKIAFLRLLMGENERDKPQDCDNYIFVTLDDEKEPTKAYILGAINYFDLWKKVEPLPEAMAAKMKYPCAGNIQAKDLKNLRNFVLRT